MKLRLGPPRVVEARSSFALPSHRQTFKFKFGWCLVGVGRSPNVLAVEARVGAWVSDLGGTAPEYQALLSKVVNPR